MKSPHKLNSIIVVTVGVLVVGGLYSLLATSRGMSEAAPPEATVVVDLDAQAGKAPEAPTGTPNEAVTKWRGHLAENVMLDDIACQPHMRSTMACKGSLCAIRHDIAWNTPTMFFNQVKRTPFLALGRAAVRLGAPATVSGCEQRRQYPALKAAFVFTRTMTEGSMCEVLDHNSAAPYEPTHAEAIKLCNALEPAI